MNEVTVQFEPWPDPLFCWRALATMSPVAGRPAANDGEANPWSPPVNGGYAYGFGHTRSEAAANAISRLEDRIGALP